MERRGKSRHTPPEDPHLEVREVCDKILDLAEAVVYKQSLPSGEFTFWGDGVERITGYTAEELTLETWRGLIEETIPRGALAGLSLEKIQRRIESGEMREWQADLRIRTRTGETRWLANSAVHIVDEQGRPVRAVGILQDITGRGEHEEQRRRLTSILEATSDLVSIARPDGTLTYMNSAGRMLLGWDADVNIRQMMIPHVHPTWAANRVKNEAIPCAIREGVWQGESALLKADGSEIPVSQVVISHENSTGEVEYLSTIMRDISERKRVERERRASEANYRTIFDAGYDAIVVHDMQTGAILDANKRMCEMFGYTHDEALALTVEQISLGEPPYTQIEAAEWIHKAVTQGPQTFEWICKKKTGETFWVEVTLTRVMIAGHERVLATDRDITDRKQAEKERLNLERQVQHAQKLESLGVLAGGIAHDFNNLLMSILGYADLTLDALSPMSPVRSNIQEIEKASKRAADLANQMLAYSGKGRFVIESIDLNVLVEDMAHLLEISISKKIELECRFAAILPTFDGDAHQIRQILLNLIANASEAIGDSNGVITLATGTMDCSRDYLDSIGTTLRTDLDEPLPDGAYVYLEMTDTGCGMGTGTIERIYDPFFTTKFTGRGLGMSAVLGIVRGHRGAIDVSSEVEKGTTFKVLFPANESAREKIAGRKRHEGFGKGLCESGTVLIADDENAVRTVGRKMLERLGFSVLAAVDGCEALELFRKHADEIVCVLLDLTMPHMDGAETFRELRRLRPDVAVLLCSGFDEHVATQSFAGEGLAGFLQKPYNMAELRKKLLVMLDQDC